MSKSTLKDTIPHLFEAVRRLPESARHGRMFELNADPQQIGEVAFASRSR